MQYWLMKTEPETFSIDDLKRKNEEPWDGVRNFVARNHMQQMAVGDRVLFYHTGKTPGVAGVAEVAVLAHPDKTQFDGKSPYYDERATKAKPYWYCVDVRFVEKFPHEISLAQIKADPKLADMPLREAKYSRLSVQPVAKVHFDYILTLGKRP